MRSMYFFKTFILLFLFATVQSQTNPTIVWEKTYGGTLHESASEIIHTSDGGYIIVGSSMSSDGDVSVNQGQYDFWIVKLDSEGTLIWEKSYGGSDWDFGQTIIELSNGDGYIVAGQTQSSDGDITENNLDVAWWVLRLDLAGNIMWDKTLGGLGFNLPNSAIQANDGNVIIAGLNDMDGGDVTVNYGGADFWIVKMDIDGNIIWDKSFGGSGDDVPEKIIQTAEGDFLLVGYSNSSDGHISSPQGMGDNDFWVVKIDEEGNLLWEKSYGGSGDGTPFGDWAQSVVQSADGGFVIAGSSNSMDGQVTGNHGGTDDFWIIKIDIEGNLLWEKSYGGFDSDLPRFISQTDGGYIIAGESSSIDGDITNHHGEWPGFPDVWVIKIDEAGDLLWEKSFGGTGVDWARDMVLSPEGDMIVLAETYSESGDGDISHNHGESDIWVLKLQEEIMAVVETSKSSFMLYPNPFANEVNIQLPEENINGNYTFKVSDLSGKIIHSQNQKDKSFVWNGASLPKGVYVLSIESYGKTVMKKVIKK